MSVLQDVCRIKNPYQILGVSEEADEKELFAAYCQARGRLGAAADQAYAQTATPALRARSRLLNGYALASLDELPQILKARLNYIGSGLWRAATAEQKAD